MEEARFGSTDKEEKGSNTSRWRTSIRDNIVFLSEMEEMNWIRY